MTRPPVPERRSHSMPNRSRPALNLVDSRTSRRTFLKGAAALSAGLVTGFPAILRGQNLNNKLNIVSIGCGGRGAADLSQVISENIVALCDVNENNLNAAGKKLPNAKKFRDFRKLYDTLKDGEFDAVVVSTCEHTHAFATLPALLRKKHVYCEKPLTRDVHEARIITEAARKAGVATQMGTQIHATDNYHRVVELIQSGAIGPVSECHVWVSRAWGWQSEEDAKAERAGAGRRRGRRDEGDPPGERENARPPAEGGLQRPPPAPAVDPETARRPRRMGGGGQSGRRDRVKRKGPRLSPSHVR